MSYSLVGTAAGATGTGNLTPTRPTYETGDLAIFAAFARTNTETITTPPSGYTLLEAGVAGIGNSGNLAVFGKICTASESAPTVGFSGSGRHVAVMAVLRSSTGWPSITVNTDIVVTAAEASGTAAGMVAQGITPGENDCCVVAVCGKVTTANDATGVTTPSGYTDAALHIYNSATAGAILGIWFLGQTTAAAVATQTGAIAVTDDTGRRERVTLALRATPAGILYVKVLAEATAASETGIEGVVLNAARDTVIGEFSGQEFEASLESGEAVLLIPVAEITPDGSTLTTSDTPIVFAYNATDSLVGPASATVIEV